MEREKFEDSLKNAFNNGEVNPSAKVWTNIELDLEKARGGHLKKRLMFYQMLAAASVVFAMAIGGIGYYNSMLGEQADPGNLASQTPKDSHPADPRSDTQAIHDTQATEATQNSQATPGEDSPDPSNQPLEDAPARDVALRSENNSIAPIKAPENQTDRRAADLGFVPLLAIDDRNLSPFYTPRQIELILPAPSQVDPVLAMLARLEQREREVQGEKKNARKKDRENGNENLWTSIGFAAGSFSSVQSSVSGTSSRMQSLMAASAPIVEKETKASGYAYSMGVNVGTKLSERWVIQGGVNYLTHASQYMADNVVASNSNYQQQTFRAASNTEVLNFDAHDLNSKIVYTAPYNVNNDMRYLSIPMQAGYLVVNKTFGLQLNAGVATDLFLQNTLTADSDQLEKTSQPGGADSPYRSVNLSGLLGTEVSYRFGQHYRISLNPGIRYPFNTIYKSELGLQSMPLTFDVGLRFRYIFH